MKSQLFRAASILAVLTLPFAMGLSSTAQQTPTPRQQQPEQQQERPILDLPVQQVDAEALRVRVPHCPRPPVVQMHDVADNFQPPGGAVNLSPALVSYLSVNQVTPKGYDDNRVDKVFADSFKLDSCKVCYATLEVGVRHYQNAWGNDTMTVGGAPFTPTSLRVLSGYPIWNPPITGPINITSFLNSYIFSNNNVSPLLDIVAQDDTDFDYVKLTIWY